jgi:hypothetical protein
MVDAFLSVNIPSWQNNMQSLKYKHNFKSYRLCSLIFFIQPALFKYKYFQVNILDLILRKEKLVPWV